MNDADDKPLRIVLDTNALVSAILSPLGNPKKILNLVFIQKLILLFDERIFSEYEEVLKREDLHLPQKSVDQVLSFLKEKGVRVIAHPLAPKLPDPDDLPFLEVAFTGQVDVLMTGNKRHFPSHATQGIPVMSPSEFLEKIQI